MATVKYLLRDKTAKNKTSIIAYICFDGKRLVISTGEHINPKYWSATKERVLSTYGGGASEINTTLSNLKDGFETCYNDFKSKKQREPSVNELKYKIEKEVLKRGGETKGKPHELFEYFRYYIENQKKIINQKTGRKISYPTIRLYENVLLKLKRFSDLQSIKVDFDTIDLEFYNNYVKYLSEVESLEPNSIGGHIKVIKALMNDAFSNGITTNLIFKSKKFSKPSEETSEIYLNEEELKEIENLDLSNNHKLSNARDLLLLLCWTGQRFQSLPDIIEPNNRNSDFISIVQPKGNKRIEIPILPPVKRILDRGEVNAISNVNLNKYIKEVCKLVPRLNDYADNQKNKSGLKVHRKIEKYKLVCTHTGRRSFCTNFYKLGYPVDLIMGISGHESERTFYTYIREVPKEKAQRFLSVFNEKNKSLMHKVV